MSELSAVLQQINDSLGKTSEALAKLQEEYIDGSPSDDKLKRYILGDSGDVQNVSLLSLKNGSMLAYINSLLLIIGDKMDKTGRNNTATASRERSIHHRVVLERGVKPLEKKLSYQLDKLTRAYNRMEKEYVEAQERALQKLNGDVSGSSGSDDDDDDEEEEEELSYRPNATAMMGTSVTPNRERSGQEDDQEAVKADVYRPPKISAALPPRQQHFEDKFNAQDFRDRSGRSHMQAMDEYIKEASEQPDVESSIGANILQHGRGGVKSQRDAEKERRITDYEEENFTRLNAVGNKVERKKRKQQDRLTKMNMIGGEDFGIFNSKRRLEESTSRRGTKKTRSAWDRAKRKL